MFVLNSDQRFALINLQRDVEGFATSKFVIDKTIELGKSSEGRRL